MKTLQIIFVFLTLSLISFAQNPIPPSVVNFAADQENTLIIQNFAYNSCIDTKLNVPLWVSHAISKELIEKGKITRDRPGDYTRDPQFPIIKLNGYSSSGYDHGHMAPARDFKWNSGAWCESFYMTNMAPQHGCFNQKGWCHLA